MVTPMPPAPDADTPDFSNWSCPLPLRDHQRIVMGHGGGGRRDRECGGQGDVTNLTRNLHDSSSRAGRDMLPAMLTPLRFPNDTRGAPGAALVSDHAIPPAHEGTAADGNPPARVC